jgi:hypothetical protein
MTVVEPLYSPGDLDVQLVVRAVGCPTNTGKVGDNVLMHVLAERFWRFDLVVGASMER